MRRIVSLSSSPERVPGLPAAAAAGGVRGALPAGPPRRGGPAVHRRGGHPLRPLPPPPGRRCGFFHPSLHGTFLLAKLPCSVVDFSELWSSRPRVLLGFLSSPFSVLLETLNRLGHETRVFI